MFGVDTINRLYLIFAVLATFAVTDKNPLEQNPPFGRIFLSISSYTLYTIKNGVGQLIT
jgi:hypothetical protein